MNGKIAEIKMKNFQAILVELNNLNNELESWCVDNQQLDQNKPGERNFLFLKVMKDLYKQQTLVDKSNLVVIEENFNNLKETIKHYKIHIYRCKTWLSEKD